MTVAPDHHPLSVRVKVLADMFAAQGRGHRKTAEGTVSAALVAEHNAAWLAEAAEVVKGAGR